VFRNGQAASHHDGAGNGADGHPDLDVPLPPCAGRRKDAEDVRTHQRVLMFTTSST
jgi:hypothetical protein